MWLIVFLYRYKFTHKNFAHPDYIIKLCGSLLHGTYIVGLSNSVHSRATFPPDSIVEWGSWAQIKLTAISGSVAL